MGRNQGREFEKTVEATFDGYASGGIARLMMMPVPTRQVGMVGRPVPHLLRRESKWVGGPPPPAEAFPCGKVTILFFWSSYCESCPVFFRLLGSLLHDYREQGLQVFGVSRLYGRVEGFENAGKHLASDKEAELLDRFCKKFSCPFPTILDTTHEIERAFYISEIPHLLVIGRKGVLRCFFSGQTVERDLLEGLIQELLKEKTGG